MSDLTHQTDQEPSRHKLTDDQRNWLIWACGFAAGSYMERAKLGQNAQMVSRACEVEHKLNVIALELVSQL